MQFYFFRSPDKTYSVLFRKFAVKKNVATARMLAIAAFIFSGGILLSGIMVDYNSFIPNYPEYLPAITFIMLGSVIYYLSFYILKRMHFRGKAPFRQFFSVGYAMVLLTGCMWLTFLAQYNPKNTMTFLLLGTFTVSVLWVLERWETFIIMALTIAVFAYGMHYFQTHTNELYQNYVVAVIIMGMFYFISRVTYSHNYNYFQQLKLIELKNREISIVNNTQRGILNVVGHDLRSPINNITAIINLLQDHPASEEERNEYYKLILNSTRDADHIIHDLVGIANENGKELQKTEVCLNDFLKTIHAEWEYRIPNEQKLVFNEPFGLVHAYIHLNKMRRVLNNLIDNAIKFTPAGGTITLELQKLEEKVRISVNDTGIGIPHDLQPFLFDRFSKASRAGLNGEKSYGLGLSICLQIIQEHDGELLIESREQKGSSFHIDIPHLHLT